VTKTQRSQGGFRGSQVEADSAIEVVVVWVRFRSGGRGGG